MKNLFICHTQAHLILASGLVSGRFSEDENFLILFVDFAIKDELKSRLNRTFSRTLYLQSIYPSEFNTVKSKLKWYPRDWRLIKDFLTAPIDRVFAVCDWLLLVQKTLQLAHRLNQDTEMAWLEDGISAYYSDSNIHRGMDRYKITLAFRSFLFRYILGVGKFYDRDFDNSGGLHCIKQVYTCIPEAVREPYRSKRQLIGISNSEYLKGLSAIYPKSNLNILPNSVILVVDKLDRYAFPDKARVALSRFIDECKENGKTVVCKFHPRETEIWDIFKDCRLIDQSVGIESAYVSLADIKDSITVAGIKSTGLMSAKKLGYKTISLFNSCGENNPELERFFARIGVEML